MGLVALSGCRAAAPADTPRLERIQKRGALGCGIEPAVPGFAEQDAQGGYRGLDIDVCRAVAAAVLGSPDKVRFIPADAVQTFLRDDTIDLVARRLTWELKREGSFGLLFGPVTFYDGQGFLARKGTSPSDIGRFPVCVAGGTVFDVNLNVYAANRSLTIDKTIVDSAHDYQQIAFRLADGRCRVYTGDVSDLGAIRSKLPAPDDFDILDVMISKEPLAPVVRQHDAAFFTIVRWTIFALIAAEDLGVTSRNVDEMRHAGSVDIQRLLGTQPGNGKAIGLSEDWAYQAIKAGGNYGELFERNLGAASAIKLSRGANRLARDGGLMYAPPLR